MKGVMSQALVLYGLSVEEPLAGALHTAAALLHPSLDVIAEVSLLASDTWPILRPLSLGLCALCAVRFARGRERWCYAEAVNSTADGVWTLAAMRGDDDDALIPRFCWFILALMALVLLVDEL